MDVHASAGAHDIGHHHAHSQCQRGKTQEIQHGLTRHAAGLFKVRHACNAGADRQEDNRRNDHFDQFDKPVSQRFEQRCNGGEQSADKNTCRHGCENLKIKEPLV